MPARKAPATNGNGVRITLRDVYEAQVALKELMAEIRSKQDIIAGTIVGQNHEVRLTNVEKDVQKLSLSGAKLAGVILGAAIPAGGAGALLAKVLGA